MTFDPPKFDAGPIAFAPPAEINPFEQPESSNNAFESAGSSLFEPVKQASSAPASQIDYAPENNNLGINLDAIAQVTENLKKEINFCSTTEESNLSQARPQEQIDFSFLTQKTEEWKQDANFCSATEESSIQTNNYFSEIGDAASQGHNAASSAPESSIIWTPQEKTEKNSFIDTITNTSEQWKKEAEFNSTTPISEIQTDSIRPVEDYKPVIFSPTQQTEHTQLIDATKSTIISKPIKQESAIIMPAGHEYLKQKPIEVPKQKVEPIMQEQVIVELPKPNIKPLEQNNIEIKTHDVELKTELYIPPSEKIEVPKIEYKQLEGIVDQLQETFKISSPTPQSSIQEQDLFVKVAMSDEFNVDAVQTLTDLLEERIELQLKTDSKPTKIESTSNVIDYAAISALSTKLQEDVGFKSTTPQSEIKQEIDFEPVTQLTQTNYLDNVVKNLEEETKKFKIESQTPLSNIQEEIPIQEITSALQNDYVIKELKLDQLDDLDLVQKGYQQSMQAQPLQEYNPAQIEFETLNLKPLMDAANQFIDEKKLFSLETQTDLQKLSYLDRIKPDSLMPDFKQFGQEFKFETEELKLEKYTDYVNAHTNMVFASKLSGLDFDTKTFIPDIESAVKITELFKDQEVLDVFRKGNEINISPDYLGQTMFFDKNSPKFDEVEFEPLKEQFTNTPASFLPPSDEFGKGTLFLDENMDKDFFVNGGYYHERFHAQIRETYKDDFLKLEEEFDLGNNKFLNGIASSFEEVTTDLKTYDFVDDKNRFLNNLNEKYQFPKTVSKSNLAVDKFIESSPEFEVAESMLTFYHVDKERYDKIEERLNYNQEKIGIEQVEFIKDAFKEMKTQIEQENLINGVTNTLNNLDRKYNISENERFRK
ncbi:hypothetical protein HOK51_08980 [Candidatus Woesearchaeota archaeon]|jgi:hypothetical protein|nr:hypothetical protein [Candidatus Woesearchaeota archaeon]MBT6519962.1 hypothetical protein [Candidatus Woesearchaeota archaeon]MBT7367837.1 hypothetical protein [Candidatus Woesearchaeota archaeon]